MYSKITFVAAHGPLKEPLFADAAEGFKKHGIESLLTTGKHADTMMVGCWGWKLGEQLHRKGHRVLVFENGYLGNRAHWVSMAWNGLNNRADFCLPPEVTPDRFEANFELKPWKKDGKYILITGQVVGDMSLMGHDLTGFYNEIAARARMEYKLPVYFRPHPVGEERRGNFKPNIPVLPGTLEEALADAHVLMTFNSNSAVDAVLNGVPAITFDFGSMAFPVTGHDVQCRFKPGRARTEWAARLAHCQWSREEIRDGAFWRNLHQFF